MNSYLVERYLPGCSEADVRSALVRAQAACAELRSMGSEIRYLGSIFLALEEACFCRFDSERPETIVEVNQRAQFAFTRITPGAAIAPESQFAREGAVALDGAGAPQGAGAPEATEGAS